MRTFQNTSLFGKIHIGLTLDLWRQDMKSLTLFDITFQRPSLATIKKSTPSMSSS